MNDPTHLIDESGYERRKPQLISYTAVRLYEQISELRHQQNVLSDTMRAFEARFDTTPVSAPPSKYARAINIAIIGLALAAVIAVAVL
jgi:hypothetical protein